ncbi:MarR family winged helix-turn-helix transcriptional regulator [Pseudodonghicola flavimaris]|uniref:MarR family transcriptional regulator n=1 Tax=Pseudodonghicola flavimaris TaxID=3050036 RepID=A0ABT7F5B6_9RHOB|nr:MarR family transcriptional regulator [Pseudodonghicola flavimaris]MDK3019810.1 MarR family transcriptional regulator [Pseudodonghicola flavimaris]
MTSAAPSRPRDRFGFLFVTLARRWRRVIDHELARAGLTDATWTPLVHLKEGGDDISQTELATRVGLDASSLVRLLDALEGRALIERRVDPADRRARRILLTPAGEAEVDRIRAQLRDVETELLADLSDAEIADILGGLERIDRRADEKLQQEKAE